MTINKALLAIAMGLALAACTNQEQAADSAAEAAEAAAEAQQAADNAAMGGDMGAADAAQASADAAAAAAEAANTSADAAASADDMGDADDAATRDECLQVISGQADRLQRLVDNLLNLARIEAGDAIWIKATLERVTEIITPLHPDLKVDEVRSIAFGYLARPAELLALLLEHTDPTDEDQPEPEPEGDPEPAVPNRALALPADLLDALRNAGLAKLAPRAVLYVHLSEAALLSMEGVTRVEGLGPQSLAQLRVLLSRRNLVIKPVIDLAERVCSTAYEHPESL